MRMLDPAAATGFDSDGLGLIVTLVTSNMRSLRFCASKLGALEALAKIAPHVASETVLDRILPHIVSSGSVAAAAVL